MADLSALIAELEKVNEGSAALDKRIAAELGIMPVGVQFTRNMDAARSLVPEGWISDFGTSGAAWTQPMNRLYGPIVVRGKTNPVISLCIAALKARQ